MASLARWCLICGKQLITCKHYVSLNCKRTTTGRSMLIHEVSTITNIDIDNLKYTYLCSQCERQILKIKSVEETRREIFRRFTATSEQHRQSSASSHSMTPQTTPFHSPSKQLSIVAIPKHVAFREVRRSFGFRKITAFDMFEIFTW